MTKPLCPKWNSLPWMYTLPKDSEDRSSWLNDWGLFILEWCRHENRHLISVSDILHSLSFKCENRSISEHGVLKIFRYLSNTKIAKWWDREKSRLRVYWRPLDDWADAIYLWSLDGGGITLSPYKLRVADKQFSSLPFSELKDIMVKLVKSGRAEWLDKRKRIVRILI